MKLMTNDNLKRITIQAINNAEDLQSRGLEKREARANKKVKKYRKELKSRGLELVYHDGWVLIPSRRTT